MSKRNFKLGKDENDKGRFRVCLSLYVHHMIFSHLLHLMSIFIVTASMSLYFTELKCSCASEGGEREAFQTHKRLVLAFITTWMTGTWYKLKIPSPSFLWVVLFLSSHFILIEIIWLNVCFVFHQIQKTGQIRRLLLIFLILLWLFLFVYFHIINGNCIAYFCYPAVMSCCKLINPLLQYFCLSPSSFFINRTFLKAIWDGSLFIFVFNLCCKIQKKKM